MEEFLHGVFLGFKLAWVFGMSSAACAISVAWVWKWMEWAPVHITVNVFKPGDDGDAHS